MYKVNSQIGDEEVITKELATREEAIQYMFDCCNAKDIDEFKKAQRDYNIRFFVNCYGG